MKSKLIVSIWHIFWILIFIGVFLVEIVGYSLLSPEEGGMSFWMEFKAVWYRSVTFYAIIIMFVSFLYQVTRKNEYT